MFLQQLIDKNPALIAAAVELHQSGEIPASSYVIDLDALEENGRLICDEAHRLGLVVYPMTKQLGRNPLAMHRLTAAGADGYVAVDTTCADAIVRAGESLGHVGHLVQIPRSETRTIADNRPDYWTVFTDGKAREAAAAGIAAECPQRLLARVYAEGDVRVASHDGGFDAARIDEVADAFDALDGASFGGVTSYPAMLFNRRTLEAEPAPNLRTLESVASRLRTGGREDIAVNAPGTTSFATLQMLADGGATQVEPGHGFTGTTPWHAVRDLPERPAMIYVSEVSHTSGGKGYCFGGGLYQCVDTIPGRQLQAAVGHDVEQARRNIVDVELTAYQEIDFYGRLVPSEETVLEEGDSVVMCFRAQAFYTRAFVVPISGVASGQSKVEGLFDTHGRTLDPTAFPETGNTTIIPGGRS